MNHKLSPLRRPPAWLAGVLLVSGLTTAGWSASLLSNPGFEADPAGQSTTVTGWQTYGPNNYSETGAGQAHSGTNYLKVYQGFTSSINYSGVFQDYVSGPGAVYAADGWALAPTSDQLSGQNVAWLEVTFRDAGANVLALYRSALITTNTLATGAFASGRWNDLAITNQYDPGSYQLTNTVKQLVAPNGTIFIRYQVVFQGDAANSGGSLFFDDLTLTQTAGAPYGNMNIVWSDEFSGSSINTNIWTFDTGNGGANPGWGNQELEYYTSRTNNAYVTNGALHIVAQKESLAGFNYTSARMKSQGLFSFTGGRLEWRAQLPAGTGCWPALWLLGTNINNLGWPGCGEIDVTENNGSNPLMIQGSIHSGSDATAIYYLNDGTTTTSFHTYTLDWATNAMLFYVDGHLYESQTNWTSSTGNAYPFPFNQPFFLLMNLAIGGQYLGNPTTNAINAGTTFPAQIVVDYVRLYNPTAPFRIGIQKTGSKLVLTWPSNIVCSLQTVTNATLANNASNWQPIGTLTNQMQITPTNTSAYYRLVTP